MKIFSSKNNKSEAFSLGYAIVALVIVAISVASLTPVLTRKLSNVSGVGIFGNSIKGWYESYNAPATGTLYCKTCKENDEKSPKQPWPDKPQYDTPIGDDEAGNPEYNPYVKDPEKELVPFERYCTDDKTCGYPEDKWDEDEYPSTLPPDKKEKIKKRPHKCRNGKCKFKPTKGVRNYNMFAVGSGGASGSAIKQNETNINLVGAAGPVTTKYGEAPSQPAEYNIVSDFIDRYKVIDDDSDINKSSARGHFFTVGELSNDIKYDHISNGNGKADLSEQEQANFHAYPTSAWNEDLSKQSSKQVERILKDLGKDTPKNIIHRFYLYTIALGADKYQDPVYTLMPEWLKMDGTEPHYPVIPELPKPPETQPNSPDESIPNPTNPVIDTYKYATSVACSGDGGYGQTIKCSDNSEPPCDWMLLKHCWAGDGNGMVVKSVPTHDMNYGCNGSTCKSPVDCDATVIQSPWTSQSCNEWGDPDVLGRKPCIGWNDPVCHKGTCKIASYFEITSCTYKETTAPYVTCTCPSISANYVKCNHTIAELEDGIKAGCYKKIAEQPYDLSIPSQRSEFAKAMTANGDHNQYSKVHATSKATGDERASNFYFMSTEEALAFKTSELIDRAFTDVSMDVGVGGSATCSRNSVDLVRYAAGAYGGFGKCVYRYEEITRNALKSIDMLNGKDGKSYTKLSSKRGRKCTGEDGKDGNHAKVCIEKENDLCYCTSGGNGGGGGKVSDICTGGKSGSPGSDGKELYNNSKYPTCKKISNDRGGTYDKYSKDYSPKKPVKIKGKDATGTLYNPGRYNWHYVWYLPVVTKHLMFGTSGSSGMELKDKISLDVDETLDITPGGVAKKTDYKSGVNGENGKDSTVNIINQSGTQKSTYKAQGGKGGLANIKTNQYLLCHVADLQDNDINKPCYYADKNNNDFKKTHKIDKDGKFIGIQAINSKKVETINNIPLSAELRKANPGMGAMGFGTESVSDVICEKRHLDKVDDAPQKDVISAGGVDDKSVDDKRCKGNTKIRYILPNSTDYSSGTGIVVISW